VEARPRRSSRLTVRYLARSSPKANGGSSDFRHLRTPPGPARCPLYPSERTSAGESVMSAKSRYC
jgi:hypothetical protein